MTTYTINENNHSVTTLPDAIRALPEHMHHKISANLIEILIDKNLLTKEDVAKLFENRIRID